MSESHNSNGGQKKPIDKRRYHVTLLTGKGQECVFWDAGGVLFLDLVAVTQYNSLFKNSIKLCNKDLCTLLHVYYTSLKKVY